MMVNIAFLRSLPSLISYEKRSLIITTNIEFSKWNGIFYDDQLTAALIDRLVHHSHLIVFDRDSWRFEHSLMNEYHN